MSDLTNISYLQNKVAYHQDEHAYKQLFYHFYPILLRFASNFVDNMEAAEDIVSDVMIKVWEMGHKLSFIDNLKVYLLKAVKNKSLSYLALRSTTNQPLTNSEHPTMPTSNSTEETVSFREIEEIIETAVSKLPRQCQLIFRLIKEEGLSYKQVASVLEISQNTIETQMRIAFRRVRQALDSYLAH